MSQENAITWLENRIALAGSSSHESNNINFSGEISRGVHESGNELFKTLA